MIYRFTLRNDLGNINEFYLTADNHSQLYRRILSQYGVTKENVSLLEEYEELGSEEYRLSKSYVSHLPEHKKESIIDNEKFSKAKQIFSKNVRMTEPWKSDYMLRHKVNEVPIVDANDVYNLLDTYKFVKVYWSPGEKRGVHNYFALVK